MQAPQVFKTNKELSPNCNFKKFPIIPPDLKKILYLIEKIEQKNAE